VHTLRGRTLGRGRYALLAMLTCLTGLVAALLVAEIALRIYNGGLFSIEDLRPVPWGIPAESFTEYDPLLGWVPRPDVVHTWRGGWSASIDSDRLRRNGNGMDGAPDDMPPVLAVGDSGAFGDEVEDNQSWPAHLERRLGRRVGNAGVGGYGIDQVVLRAERRVDREPVDIVVLSFVSDDVTRCGYSFRHRWKPWFRLDNGGLVLVPPPPPDVPLPESPWLVALGHSHLGRFVMERALPEIWKRSTHRRVQNDAFEVASRLLNRLNRHVTARGAKLLVVGLVGGDGDLHYVPALLDRARADGVVTLDLTGQLAAWAQDPMQREHLFRPHYHLSSAGNDWVAGRIAAELADLGWTGRPADD